jgi:lysozyme family protein
MKRMIVSLTLIAALLVPVVGRPQPAAAGADGCGNPAWEDIATLDILLAICGGDTFGVAPTPCPMQQVDVTATSTNHIYKYGLACAATGTIQVSASYDPSTNFASERLSGDAGNGAGEIQATWTCPADPWTAGRGRLPTCVNIAAEANPDTSTFDLSSLSFPISVQLLDDQSRHVLEAQLQNAINELQTPAPPPAVVTAANSRTLSPSCIACGAVPIAVSANPQTTSPTCVACGQQNNTYHAPSLVSGWPQLSLYTQGQAVTSLQYLLDASGTALAVDGKFGPGTDTAVRAYQQAQGLTVDGTVGPQTWLALIVTVQQGSQGPAVKAVQSQLASRGVALPVDGNFGPSTDTAVRAYQKAQGLTVDGIVGPQTWQALVAGR